MRLVIQRVSKAEVKVNDDVIGKIAHGLLLLLGVEHDDSKEDVEWLVRKTANMRIFSDENGHMNLSIKEIDGDILVVSQFTLHASTKKGNRPSFIKSARPEVAEPMYQEFKKELTKELGKVVESGSFGADMKVSLLNDGPVTIVIDSKNRE